MPHTAKALSRSSHPPVPRPLRRRAPRHPHETSPDIRRDDTVLPDSVRPEGRDPSTQRDAIRHGWHHAVSKGHRSEEHTSELQSQSNLVCRLLLEKKKKKYRQTEKKQLQ